MRDTKEGLWEMDIGDKSWLPDDPYKIKTSKKESTITNLNTLQTAQCAQSYISVFMFC